MIVKNTTNNRYSNFNEGQQKAIIADVKNIFVSASAGSGKTTVIIERILRLLESGIKLDNMLICTFTKTSASDMKSKLLDKLLKKRKENANVLWVKEALNNLSLASICTIDSFCAKLVKEYFYYSDIDPYFEAIEPNEAEILLALSINEEIEERLLKSEAVFLELYEILSPKRSNKYFIQLIKKVYDMMVVQPQAEKWLDKSVKAIEKHKKYLLEIENHIKKYRLSYSKENPMEPSLTKGNLEVIISFCKGVAQKYNNYKSKKAKLDFRDVAHEAHKILLNSETNEMICSRYNYIFVDEVQDIDPLQDSIFSLINANKFFVGDVKQSIYQFRLSDPSIFIKHLEKAKKDEDSLEILLKKNYRSDTGILKFCDNVFTKLMTKDFGGIDYSLDGTFGESGLGERFKPSVICSIVEKDNKDDIVSNENNIVVSEGEELPSIYSVMNHKRQSENLSDSDAEIALIVRHILVLLNKKITTKDKQERKVEFGDIVILLRSMGAFAKKLCLALETSGIPFSAQQESNFIDNLAVLDLVNYLKLVDNSLDDIVLASVLKSPFLGGFSDEELLEIRLTAREMQNGKKARKEFFVAVKEILDFDAEVQSIFNKKLYNKLNIFFKELNKIRILKNCMSIEQLAGEIIAKNSVFNKILNNGIHFNENQKIAKELALFLDSICNIDNSLNFKAQLIQLENLALVGQKTIHNNSAVRIMTVHSSKGLEFPFVILGNLSHRFNKQGFYDAILCDSDFGVALKHFDIFNGESKNTSLWQWISEKAKFKALEEELRLLYVAITRAEYQVALFATKDKKSKDIKEESTANVQNSLQWLYPIIEKQMGTVIFSPSECFEFATNNAENKKSLEKKKESADNSKIIFNAAETKKKLESFVYPYAKIPLKISVTELARMERLEKSNIAINKQGIEVGNAYHKFFEVYDFNVSIEGNWGKFEKRFTDFSKLLSYKKLKIATEKLIKAINGREIHRELQFLYKNDSGAMVQGIIDLLIIDKNSCEIIDYKTGKIDTNRKEIYSKQLAVYAEATNNILNKKTTVKKVFSLTDAHFLEV